MRLNEFNHIELSGSKCGAIWYALNEYLRLGVYGVAEPMDA
jgi:hypothetical protein